MCNLPHKLVTSSSVYIIMRWSRTSTVSPFLVAVIVGCHCAPRTIMVSSCTTIVAAAFVDKRE